MALIYSAEEIVRIAVEIENNGNRFYREAARLSRSQPAADLFKMLAEDEIKHRDYFESLGRQVPKSPLAEAYPGELELYLKALADAAIFNQQKGFKAITAAAFNEAQALELAVGAEKDSILYYHELLAFVPEDQKVHVRKILDEERRHLTSLRAFAQTLSGQA